MFYLPNYFFDPDCIFCCLKHEVIWEEIFTKPFPIDSKDIKKGTHVLSDYFEVRDISIESDLEIKTKGKMLLPRKSFFRLKLENQKTIFISLCDFLEKYKKPVIGCYLFVPHHEDIEPDLIFSPMFVLFPKPRYPEDHFREDKF